MRIGILGGSFDPVHLGHLLLAEHCREQCQLDRVWFVPAAIAPHKREKTLASAEARLDMLRLATGGQPALVVSDLEIRRGGLSFTVQTLEAIRQSNADDELFFLMGADSLADFATWKEPARICQLATPVIVQRHGSPTPDLAALRPFVPAERAAESLGMIVNFPMIDLSSSEIRRRVRLDQSIRYQTPRAVEEYIASNHLYR